MKKKLFLSIPFVLLGFLWGMNWRKWHPSPTVEDEQMRNLLASADSVKVEVTTFECWSLEGLSCGHAPKYSTRLNPAEMQPVIKYFNLIHDVQSEPQTNDDISLSFSFYKGEKEIGVITGFAGPYSYDYFMNAQARPVIYGIPLHPATASRCREVIKRHPEIVKALIAAGGSL